MEMMPKLSVEQEFFIQSSIKPQVAHMSREQLEKMLLEMIELYYKQLNTTKQLMAEKLSKEFGKAMTQKIAE